MNTNTPSLHPSIIPIPCFDLFTVETDRHTPACVLGSVYFLEITLAMRKCLRMAEA